MTERERLRNGGWDAPRRQPAHVNPVRPPSWSYDPRCACVWCRIERLADDATALRKAA